MRMAEVVILYPRGSSFSHNSSCFLVIRENQETRNSLYTSRLKVDGEGKNSVGNVEAKELISMTQGHELKGDVDERGCAGGKAIEGGNGTTVIA